MFLLNSLNNICDSSFENLLYPFGREYTLIENTFHIDLDLLLAFIIINFLPIHTAIELDDLQLMLVIPLNSQALTAAAGAELLPVDFFMRDILLAEFERLGANILQNLPKSHVLDIFLQLELADVPGGLAGMWEGGVGRVGYRGLDVRHLSGVLQQKGRGVLAQKLLHFVFAG